MTAKIPIQSPDSIDTSVLRAEPYLYSHQRDVTVTIENPEFTSVCPMTGLPDTGTVVVSYVPKDRIVELKSLKLYFMEYRGVGIFYEHAVNRILDDLVRLLEPVRMTVTIGYAPRGGISTKVVALHPEGDRS